MRTLNWTLVLLLALPVTLAGQGANAAAFGVSVNTATVTQQTPSAVLPTDGSVTVRITGTNQVGITTTTGEAQVILPSRSR